MRTTPTPRQTLASVADDESDSSTLLTMRYFKWDSLHQWCLWELYKPSLCPTHKRATTQQSIMHLNNLHQQVAWVQQVDLNVLFTDMRFSHRDGKTEQKRICGERQSAMMMMRSSNCVQISKQTKIIHAKSSGRSFKVPLNLKSSNVIISCCPRLAPYAESAPNASEFTHKSIVGTTTTSLHFTVQIDIFLHRNLKQFFFLQVTLRRIRHKSDWT